MNLYISNLDSILFSIAVWEIWRYIDSSNYHACRLGFTVFQLFGLDLGPPMPRERARAERARDEPGHSVAQDSCLRPLVADVGSKQERAIHSLCLVVRCFSFGIFVDDQRSQIGCCFVGVLDSEFARCQRHLHRLRTRLAWAGTEAPATNSLRRPPPRT